MFRAIFTSDMHRSNKLLKSHASSDTQTMKYGHQKAFFLNPHVTKLCQSRDLIYKLFTSLNQKSLTQHKDLGCPAQKLQLPFHKLIFPSRWSWCSTETKNIFDELFFDASLYFYPKNDFYIFLTIFLGQLQLEDNLFPSNYI